MMGSLYVSLGLNILKMIETIICSRMVCFINSSDAPLYQRRYLSDRTSFVEKENKKKNGQI